jgi:phosphopantetheine adenylyltransferase
MCTLNKSCVRIDKGFKEVHLIAVDKALLEHCGTDVSSTQVYNHLRKWRVMLLNISRLHDLSGA